MTCGDTASQPAPRSDGDRDRRRRVNYAASFTRDQWPAFFQRLNDDPERSCALHAARRHGRRPDTVVGTLEQLHYSAAADEIIVTLAGHSGMVAHHVKNPQRVEAVGRDEMPYRIDVIGRDGARTRLELDRA
jgi:hypothetical protein